MGVHRPPSVEEQSYVEISRWTIYQLPNGDHHLVGYIGIEGQGRVTSKIKHVEGCILTTRSGRKYGLNGPSGWNSDADYVWHIWCSFNEIDPKKAIDVSKAYGK